MSEASNSAVGATRNDIVSTPVTEERHAAYLSDVSTNGVYVNDVFVGKGKTVPLADRIGLVRASRGSLTCFNMTYSFLTTIPMDSEGTAHSHFVEHSVT